MRERETEQIQFLIYLALWKERKLASEFLIVFSFQQLRQRHRAALLMQCTRHFPHFRVESLC